MICRIRNIEIMKTAFTIIILLVLPILGNAQFEQSTHHIGGDLTFSYTSFNSGSSTFSDLSGRYGYGISDGLFIGGDISLNYRSRSEESTIIAISPFVRYYFSLNEKGGLYGEAQAGFSTAGVGNISFMNPSVGYSIAISRNFFIDLSLEYFRDFNRGSSSTISTGVGFKIALGNSNGF